MTDPWPAITTCQDGNLWLAEIHEPGNVYQGRGETEDAARAHVAKVWGMAQRHIGRFG